MGFLETNCKRAASYEITHSKVKHVEVLKLRNTITQINKSVDGINHRLDTAEEWIIKVEDIPEENNQNAAWETKGRNLKRRVSDIENTVIFSILTKYSEWKMIKKKAETIFAKIKAESLSEIMKKITHFMKPPSPAVSSR